MSGIDSDSLRPTPDLSGSNNADEPVDPGGDLSADQLRSGINQLGEDWHVDKIPLLNKYQLPDELEYVNRIKSEDFKRSARETSEFIRDKVTGRKGETLPDPVVEAYFAALQAQADAQVAGIMAQLATGDKVDPGVALDAGMLFANTRPGAGIEDLDDSTRFIEQYLGQIGLSEKILKMKPDKIFPKEFIETNRFEQVERDIPDRRILQENPLPSPDKPTLPPTHQD